MKQSDLHEYQLRAVEFLDTHTRSALFASMGTGKTIITLTHLVQQGKEKTLVITTKRVAELVWEQEAAKWEHTRHLTFSHVMGTPMQRISALGTDADIYLMNIENTQWLMAAHLLGFNTLVLDELSLWRGGGKRWKALLEFAHRTPRIIGLTGTPAPNGYLQLWPQAELIQKGMLWRNKTRYKNEYFYPTDYQRWNWALIPGKEEEILARMAPYVMRITNEELDMPELVYNRIPVKLPANVQRQIKTLAKDFIVEVEDDEIVAENAAVVLGKIHQFGQGMIYVTDGTTHLHDAKLDAVKELVEDMQGEPTLIAYRYHHDRTRLQTAFPDAGHLGAGVSKEDALETVQEWNQGKMPVLLIHPDSAGHGLNLQGGGHHIIWYGLTWDLDKFDQLNARLFRQGQSHETVFVHLLLAGDLDRVIADLLIKKDISQQKVLKYFEEIGK